MKLSTLVLAFIAWKVLFEKKTAPRGTVDIGDALIGSNPNEWKPWPGDEQRRELIIQGAQR